MNEVVRTLRWTPAAGGETLRLLQQEWLVTNGLGGFASGTLAGVPTRRYHGLLIAALPAPLGRLVMFNHLTEELEFGDGTVARIGGEQHHIDDLDIHGCDYLTEFRLEMGLPVWRYQIGEVVIEKQIFMPHMQNTVHVVYRLLQGSDAVRLQLQPSFQFRPLEASVSYALQWPYVMSVSDDHYEIGAGPDLRLRMTLHGEHASLTASGGHAREVFFRVEADRGYDARGQLWTAGRFGVDLKQGTAAVLVASTESWDTVQALQPAEALAYERERRQRLIHAADARVRSGPAAELVLSADMFIVTPAGRVEDAARARAAGDEVRTVIAGYHWFTDWGRDTMISLEGLTLTTGRPVEAGWILRTFGHYIRRGLIPNMFPEGENEGLYHTADATLWFFHALERYVRATNDRETLRALLPKLKDVADHHVRGTSFGIGVDPADGLLKQGQEHYQLTWMDAKVEDWVVTPRRGKAVEINALWYNALRLIAAWLEAEHGEAEARVYSDHAGRAREAFNKRFWYSEGGYLYDVVDGEKGDDPACRPNQLLAISLDHPVLDRARWESVLKVAEAQLLTPVGLRSLAPGHPDYKAKYFGDLRARDAAYHQGTVWAWLIGPYIDAWLKVHPDDRAGARRFLEGFTKTLDEACIGSISEIFDAESPYTPRGCIAQAWSVAEVLRCWAITAE